MIIIIITIIIAIHDKEVVVVSGASELWAWVRN